MKRLLTLVLAMSCGGIPAAGCARDAAAQALPASPTRTAVVWPGAVGPVVPDPKIEARIHDLLRQLALEQKVAQMMQADIRYVTPEDERKYRLGSVFNGGGAFPGNDKHAAVSDWVALADRFYDASMKRSARATQSDRKSTRLKSSHSQISYAVFCFEKKNKSAAAKHRNTQ